MSLKYVFVTGGVVSSLGKGLAAASIGCLLESRGLRVTLQKFDPYLNVDPGTMSPFQHGEVYVTDDGAETDLDLGHYERFTHARLTHDHNWTTGRIYETIITKERRGDYLGKTVQVIPHVTNESKSAIKKVSQDVDVVIVEIGGTVGDIESLPFVESLRQMRQELGRQETVFVHLTLVPFIQAAGELKTKPTQHSVKQLLELGIQPDILLCRTDRFLSPELKAKIALFCNVSTEAVITARDVDCVYEVPLMLAREGLDDILLRCLNLPAGERRMEEWERLVERVRNPADTVTIGMVGKYVEFEDSYKSLKEALVHGGLAHNLRVDLRWIEAEGVEGPDWMRQLEEMDGILVPGGFGKRGVDELGGTMRLGAWPCKLAPESLAHKAYGTLEISERHRHRYEFNREYEETLVANGLRLSGATPDGTYVEIVELAEHPWYLGCQFHPEFKSKPFDPHPLFRAFIAAARRNRQERAPAGEKEEVATARKRA